MTLAPGSAIPSFDLEDARGGRVRREDLRGRWTVLAFHRFVGCPLCNVGIRDLAVAAATLPPEVVLLNVFESSLDNVKTALETWGSLPFRCLADPEAKAFEAFGVETSVWGALRAMGQVGLLRRSISLGLPRGVASDGSKTRLPAAFLVDADLTLGEVHYARTASDALGPELLHRWAASARTSAPRKAPSTGASARAS